MTDCWPPAVRRRSTEARSMAKMNAMLARFRHRPWPVEATILAGLALWLGWIVVFQQQASNLRPTACTAALLTALSSFVSCYVVWSQCCWTTVPPSFKTTRRSNNIHHPKTTAFGGADPDGLSVGATLVPLLFCSALLFVGKCNSTNGHDEVVPSLELLEAFAVASSVTSLLFAFHWAFPWDPKGFATAWKRILLPATCLLLFASAVSALGDIIIISPLVFGCIWLQGIMLYLCNRSGQFVALTSGEWCCVIELLSSLVVGFLFYNIIDRKARPALTSANMHIAIAHGGLVGCILGCSLSTILLGVSAKSGRRSIILECTAKLATVVCVTGACVEIVARRWHAAEAKASSYHRLHPVSLQWLVLFLSTPDESTPGFFWNAPRWVFLVYWLLILVLAAFPAQWMASHLLQLSESEERRKLVVVARKYFHLIAVLLFLPPTIIAPSMMTLSYAVALCVLLLVETMRTTVLADDKPVANSLSMNAFYEAFLDEKDVMTRSNNKPGITDDPSSKPASRSRQSGRFVVTHVALIFGCGFPLWANEVMRGARPGCFPTEMYSLLPSMGIIALGVGDAVGAIVGVHCGTYIWPGTKRTIEGSLGMFLSMVFISGVIDYFDPASSARSMRGAALFGLQKCPQLLIITVLEAFTNQIDNLCLPIAASILCLLQW